MKASPLGYPSLALSTNGKLRGSQLRDQGSTPCSVTRGHTSAERYFISLEKKRSGFEPQCAGRPAYGVTVAHKELSLRPLVSLLFLLVLVGAYRAWSPDEWKRVPCGPPSRVANQEPESMVGYMHDSFRWKSGADGNVSDADNRDCTIDSCGRNSMEEFLPSKQAVEGSNPFVRFSTVVRLGKPLKMGCPNGMWCNWKYALFAHASSNLAVQRRVQDESQCWQRRVPGQLGTRPAGW